MKSIRRASLFISLFPLLIACSKNSYAGKYVFQMGKSKGTHMSVQLDLTKDVFDPEKPEKGKIFTLTLDALSSDSENDFAAILEDLNPVTGYYSVNPNEKVYDEKRLNLGLRVLGEYDIPEEITNLIFVANINSKEANFFLPVSIADLQLQLYWYGYELDWDALLSEETDKNPFETPDGPHPVGSHPTQEDIDRINEHYKDTHGSAFRDYHVLKLGLTKQ